MNKFEIEGKWKNVTQNDWIHGTLSFDPERGSSISVFGSFSEHPIVFVRHQVGLVVGKTPMGDFTLLDLDYRSFSSNRHYGTITSYNVSIIFKGIQVDSKDELIFNEVTFSTLNLDSWFNPPNLTIHHNFDDWSFTIDGRSTELGAIPLNDNILLKVYHDVSIKPQNNSNNHIIEKFTDFNFTYITPQNWHAIWENIQCSISFISFCTNEQSYPNKIVLKDSSFTKNIGTTTIKVPVELYLQTTLFHSSSSPNNSRDHLIPYAILKDNFHLVFKKWFELHATFYIPINLVNSRLKSKRKFNENRFLDAAHALEVFHRLDSNMSKFTPEHFEKLRFTAINAFSKSKNDREWMEQLLSYANEPSLRNRLKDLIDRYNLDFLFEDNREKKEFINSAINTRNYFTHYDSSIKSQKASGTKLIYNTRTLTAILYLCITFKLDINRVKTREIIKEMFDSL